MVFAAKIQLQIVVAVVVVDRHTHLEHLRHTEKNPRSNRSIIAGEIAQTQILPVPRILSYLAQQTPGRTVALCTSWPSSLCTPCT